MERSNEDSARDRQEQREERERRTCAQELTATLRALLGSPVVRTEFTDPPVDWDRILAR